MSRFIFRIIQFFYFNAFLILDVVDNVQKPKHWSPYGCHYFPDPDAFPPPRLDSLPQEPLKRGEQYYLDLAGKTHWYVLLSKKDSRYVVNELLNLLK